MRRQGHRPSHTSQRESFIIKKCKKKGVFFLCLGIFSIHSIKFGCSSLQYRMLMNESETPLKIGLKMWFEQLNRWGKIFTSLSTTCGVYEKLAYDIGQLLQLYFHLREQYFLRK